MTGRDRHPGDRLAALVDGRLVEPERSRVVEHVAGCGQCLADYDAQLALKGMLRHLGSPGAPAGLRARLADLPRTRPDATQPGGPRRPRPRRDPSRRPGRAVRLGRVAAGAAALSVILLGGGYALGGGAQGNVVVPPVDQFVREHAAVEVGIPLTEPALSQLIKGAAPVLTPTGSQSAVPAAPTVPAGTGRPTTGTAQR
jgi:anti-sigma factor RsiW